MAPPAEASPSRLHELLPELLSALCEKFDNVECELENSPDFSSAPYKLPITKIGSQLCMVPTTECADLQTAIKQHLNGGATLGVIEGFYVLCSSANLPALGLRISLKTSTPSASSTSRQVWRRVVADTIRRVYPNTPWEFLCVESIESEKSELILLSKAPLPPVKEATSSVSSLNIWLFPFNKIVFGSHQVQQQAQQQNGNAQLTNGTESTTPKAKKKVIRRVIKGTNPDGTPKKTLVSSKTELANGTKVVKKKIVDKSTPKENSPDVVQGVTEDPNNIKYLVRTDQPPGTNDQLTSQLTEKLNKELTNGVSKMQKNAAVNGIVKVENKESNGVVENTLVNGVDIKKPDGQPEVNGSIKETATESANQNKPLSLSPPTSTKAPDLAIVDQTKPSPNIAHSTTPIIPHNKPDQTFSTSNLTFYEQPPDPLSDNEKQLSVNTTLPSANLSSTSPTLSLKVDDSTESKSQSPSSEATVINSSINSSMLAPRVLSPSSAAAATLSRRTESPLTLSESTVAPSSFNTSSFISSRRLSNPVNPLSPTESDASFMEDFSFASTLTTPSLVRQTTGSEKHEMSPISELYPPDVKMRGMMNVPVVALQLVLSLFSYKELCELRQVSPHWDELCGQLLNSGYYELIHKADILMTECQKRVNSEKHMQRPLQVLTNLQVHVLNPVDILRAAMDEGVLCFPYGDLLDKAFGLLDKVEQVMGMSEEDGDIDNKWYHELPYESISTIFKGVVLNWERLSKLSRTAQVHYRRFVEPEVEKRMTEVYKLSAQQRLQRLDSFLVETSVNKLEKVTEKARDELKWEVEQLKTQNTQLKKDNRDLKQTCAKLESRIETIERKLKTLGRLLQ